MKACIETYGCAANQAESEAMAGILSKEGFSPCDEPASADIIVVNTCFVKSPTEQKVLQRIRRLVSLGYGSRLIIAGCMPDALGGRLARLAPRASLVGTHNVTRIAEAAHEALAGRRACFTGDRAETRPGSPRVRRNGLIGITEISEGCGGSCAYCCVRLAKGPMRCFPGAAVVEDAGAAIREGCREVWLTSQDCGSYSSGRAGLPELVESIAAIGGDFMIRVGMMNPDSALRIAGGLSSALNGPKAYRFVHIPLQSGSDRVLGLMRRKYRAQDFLGLVRLLREGVPGISIMTDVIAGFPGETDGDLGETLRVIAEARPDVVNVSRFGPRPGTEAAGMPQLPDAVIKARSAAAIGLARRISVERNQEWIGWKGPVLVTERGTKPGQCVGHNPSYKPVLLESAGSLMGKTVIAEITSAALTHLKGRIARGLTAGRSPIPCSRVSVSRKA